MSRIRVAVGIGVIATGSITKATASEGVPAPIVLEDLKIHADDAASTDGFGGSVAVSGSVAIVGAPGDDDNGWSSGSAYLFDVTTGTQLAKLLPTDGSNVDYFGSSVAISGSTAIVGADSNDDFGPSSGSAYLFDVATGTQIAKLLPSDGAADDFFGYSVATSDSVAIVGARLDDDNGSDSGSVYLFDAATGSQLAKLLPTDGAQFDYFGYSVAISGSIAIVGARMDDDNGTNSGSAYLFDVTTGEQLAKLLPNDGAAFDHFGDSVAISGSTAIVGAYYDDENGFNSGSAYLFDVATGTQMAKLLPSDGASADEFGHSVAISDSIAIVGARFDDDNGTSSGSAYLFDVTSGAQLAKLLPSDGAAADYLGSSVTISGSTVIAGASGDDDIGSSSGSAYIVYLYDCPTDLDGSGETDLQDLHIVLSSFGENNGGDVDGNGTTDLQDLNAVLAEFGNICL